MDLTAWALYAFIAAAALAGAVWHYRRREPAGRGRAVLGLLRGLAVAVLVLLLFDPSVPAGPAAGRSATVVLIDGSLSMGLADAAGRTRWAAAVEEAAALDPDRIELVGGGRTRAVDRLEAVGPTIPTSRIAPGLRAALESGASRVVLITDGALEDAPEVRELVRASGRVEVRRVGSATAFNAGIVEVRAPRWVEAGDGAAVEALVGRLGRGGPDSLEVVLLDGGREAARRRIASPPEGRLGAVAFRYAAPPGAAGRRLLEVVLEPGDAVAEDDRRAAVIRVGREPPGVALVSFRPDQEPRFLLPVLERALGVPGRGWLALGEDRYVRLGMGADAGGAADAAEVRTAVDGAGLVVLHGLDDGAPAWARAAVGDARRLLVFPAGPSVAGLPLAPGPLAAGDWYVAAEVPPSPVAPLLAGVAPGDAPPLMGLRTPTAAPGFWAPLRARESRSGPPRPVVLAASREGRRIAVALGDGYWRWAFSGGTSRALYDRLWSAVGGWLVEETAGEERPVAPEPPVVARAAPIRWAVGSGVDSVRITVRGGRVGDAAVLADTTVAVTSGTATTAAIPPGRYTYTARTAGSEDAGELVVESYSPEFTRGASPLELAPGPGAEAGDAARRRPARPLRALPWAYALVVVLLCAEWLLRRRWGLR